MPDFLSEFTIAMTELGLASAEKIIPDDTIHRYRIINETNRNGAYRLRIDGNFAVGWFRSHKEGITHKWNSKGEKLTKEEKINITKRLNLDKKKHEASIQEAQLKAEKKAQLLYSRAAPGDNGYCAKKKIKNVKKLGNDLIIPIYDKKILVNIQRIQKDGKKRFLTGGKILGCYSPVGSSPGDVIIVCEGYATASTLNDCTGLPVAVAFSTSNLLPVAKNIRTRYPDIEIIFAADNDQWTKKPDGTPFNPGLSFARGAADVVGGRVISPLVDSEQPSRPTDWNDIFCLYGSEQIKKAFKIEPPKPEIREETPFRILGYNEGSFYYLPKSSGQLTALSASAHSINNLMCVAPLHYWEESYGAKNTSHSKIALFAANSLIQAAHRKGVFSQDDRLRGPGAWIDKGRKVLHCGDMLAVDGKEVHPYNFNSRYIYSAGEKILDFSSAALTTKEALQLKEICEMLSWENPLSASLLAGWCVLAPVCAMLPWRPHIWVTAGAGAGKSTIMDKIIQPILGQMALHESGGTTEASLRQKIGHSGRPVIYDEAEAEDKKDSGIMSAVLLLARRSSSGGIISKGTPDGKGAQFQVRSIFCFASVNISLKKRPDESRVSILGLKKSHDAEKYAQIVKKIREVITPEYAKGLLARTVECLDVLIDNCTTFTDAARGVLCDGRAAEQVGALAAGLYLLHSKNRISFDEATIFIKKHNWESYTAINDDTEPQRLLSHLCMSTIKVGMVDKSIGVLITSSNYTDREALREIGIVVKDCVKISTTSPRIARILDGTAWGAKWGRTLIDIDGATKIDSMFFTPGHKARAVGIPLQYFDSVPQKEKDETESVNIQEVL